MPPNNDLLASKTISVKEDVVSFERHYTELPCGNMVDKVTWDETYVYWNRPCDELKDQSFRCIVVYVE
jgi:hypothetical protein